jgi:cytidylate kinase
MAIITISHQLGCNGARIAQAVAERLGYQCAGSEMLAKAAHEYGLGEDRLSELGETKPSILDRLEAETRIYIAVMQNAVLDVALQDDVIVLGRGGQWLLRDLPHVVRVRIVASFDERVRRLAAALTAQDDRRHGLQAARDAIIDLLQRDDADKRGRMRYLYDRDINDPELYDVVCNASRDDMGMMTDGIVALARHPTFATTDESRRPLVDRAVASRVRVALMMDERTRGAKHSAIEVDAGRVRITSTAARAVVDAVARSVPGVESVHVDEPAEQGVQPLWRLYRSLFQ